MKVYKGQGEVLKLIAPAAVSSGVGYMIGSGANKIFAVAQADAASAASFAAVVEGVVEMPKDTAAVYVVGEVAFWDDTAKNFNESAAGRFAVGYAVEAAGAGVLTAKVKLLGHSVVAV